MQIWSKTLCVFFFSLPFLKFKAQKCTNTCFRHLHTRVKILCNVRLYVDRFLFVPLHSGLTSSVAMLNVYPSKWKQESVRIENIQGIMGSLCKCFLFSHVFFFLFFVLGVFQPMRNPFKMSFSCNTFRGYRVWVLKLSFYLSPVQRNIMRNCN